MTGAYWGDRVTLLLIVGQEGSLLTEISGGSDIWTVAFAANGENIVGGGDGLGVWRVNDGKEMAAKGVWGVRSLAVSQDGRWIAAGTMLGHVFVWDAQTLEKIFTHNQDLADTLAVDFSPDSTRLVTASKNRTVTVWDVAARQKVLTLDHGSWVVAAKYSPQGDRIATATFESVRVWDSNDGRLLVDIPVQVTPLFNTGLLWFNNHLFVVSDSTIKQFEASTGSTISDWSVPDDTVSSCIALPQHGDCIAYATNDTVTFLDTSTHAQLGSIQHTESIRSIVPSPDDRFLAVGGNSGKIAIKDLRDVLPASYWTVSIVYCLITASE